MYWRSKKTPVGVAAAGTMTPSRLLFQPISVMTRKTGIKMTDSGTMSVPIVITSTVSRPRN